MRMGFGLLMGVLIILFGFGIIINVVFDIHIPVFKILAGLLLVYFGLRIILGNYFPLPNIHFHPEEAAFGHRAYHGLANCTNEYNAVFSKAMIDLRGKEIKEKVARVKVAAVFGSAEIILDKNTPVRIKAESVFGDVQLPKNVTGIFGSAFYQSQGFDENKSHLFIDASSVFSSIEIHY